MPLRVKVCMPPRCRICKQLWQPKKCWSRWWLLRNIGTFWCPRPWTHEHPTPRTRITVWPYLWPQALLLVVTAFGVIWRGLSSLSCRVLLAKQQATSPSISDCTDYLVQFKGFRSFQGDKYKKFDTWKGWIFRTPLGKWLRVTINFSL